MEQLGLKISVIIAVLIGALYRAVKIKSREETKMARCIDIVFTFVISIGFALVLLNPVMALLGIPVAYETILAMVLALSSESILKKVLRGVDEFNAAKALEAWIVKKYGVKVDVDNKEERKDNE